MVSSLVWNEFSIARPSPSFRGLQRPDAVADLLRGAVDGGAVDAALVVGEGEGRAGAALVAGDVAVDEVVVGGDGLVEELGLAHEGRHLEELAGLRGVDALLQVLELFLGAVAVELAQDGGLSVMNSMARSMPVHTAV